CAKNDCLLIVDEVQTGIGRTGKAFGYQHYNLEPDIVTTAKGLGNGLPVGAMIGKAHLKETFNAGSHGSTFGGNPVAMAAAKATLEEIFTSSFLKEVTEKGEFLKEELQEALKDSKRVKEIRGKGLIIGIECTDAVGEDIKKLQQEGLLVLVAGPNVVRLLPPLIISKEEITIAVKKLAKVLQ
ncbi:MAG TPA: aminotransferase class III-fold pyridoxal phosphate-dependent enzyme, partial [Massilibacterium sp.]|nr:aminotransferase class III-fold pyridoxal phosphate-dependent enzyme [Massilibacterium sp.]